MPVWSMGGSPEFTTVLIGTLVVCHNVRIHTLILTKSHDSVIFGRVRKFRRLFICLRMFPSQGEEPSVTYFLVAKQVL